MQCNRMRMSLAISLAALLCASGCDILGFKALAARPVYLEKGQGVELARPAKLLVIVTDKKTGERTRCTLEAWPGYVVARLEDGPSKAPVAPKPTAEENPSPAEIDPDLLPLDPEDAAPQRLTARAPW